MNAISQPALHLYMPDLSRLTIGGLSGFTRWHYFALPDRRTGAAHRLAEVLSPGYFNDAGGEKLIRAGDMIDVSAHDGAATLYVVEADRGQVVVEVMCRTPERRGVGAETLTIAKVVLSAPARAA